MLLVVCLAAPACKGNDDAAPAPRAEQPPVERPAVQPAAALPAGFPLPETASRKLVRSQSRLSMQVWEYEYRDLAASAAAQQLATGFQQPAFELEDARETGGVHRLLVKHAGRSYAIAAGTTDGRTTVTIRAFPEAGPTTTPPPPAYPQAFPFLAGGTSSHAPQGAELRIAYPQDASDIELAMIVAAQRAGWECTGGDRKPVSCTKAATRVSFTTQPAPGGSLVVVSAR
jgi:hypothetical protein